MFNFALQSAPSVLYSKYKQFGQVRLIFPFAPWHVSESVLLVAWGTGLVRRVQRADRFAEAAWFRGEHVRRHPDTSPHDVLRSPPTSPGRQDADHRHVSLRPGSEAETVLGRGQAVG